MTSQDIVLELDVRRRKLRYRAWHRGTREMDIVLGRFADAALDGMSASELDAFEALIDVPDPDLLAWVLGQHPVSPSHDDAMFHRLVAFHRAERDG